MSQDCILNASQEENRHNSELKTQFDQDIKIIAEQSVKFIEEVHPSYLLNEKKEIQNLTYDNSNEFLDSFNFFRIVSCTVNGFDDVFEFLNDKINKFYTALYHIGKPIVYGIVSYNGTMNLVIGLYDFEEDMTLIKNIIEGLLDNVELVPYKTNFTKRKVCEKDVGLISAIPSIRIEDEKQKFSLASMMRSLNGQDYTVLFISRPISQEKILYKCGQLISIKDKCFSVSKRSISKQQGISKSVGDTKGWTKTNTHSISESKTKNSGWSFIIFNTGKSKSETKTDSYSISNSYSQTITDTINKNEGISSDIQNGFALEMIDYTDKAIDRFEKGKNNGMWETVISYSADSKLVSSVIKSCISGEFAKPNSNIPPIKVHEFHIDGIEADRKSILIPKILMNEKDLSSLCSVVTSEELGLMCTLPDAPVPNFELKKGKIYPLITDDNGGIEIGHICSGKRILKNMSFSLTYRDLARHTFVCGITGSGKTTTVKNILINANIPFLVIESAKKEYRNISLKDNKRPKVYTLGKTEINCLQFNPFYIQCGVSPQMHIDFLKDLFNASFSFYGPMPYILEKCLQNIYKKKGWNLTLGFHPYFTNMNNSIDFFDADYMQEKYALKTHKYIFPTMQELKFEIERYIEKEMNYEGEVAGNIKTAIKARLDSLCSGSKGYMFNTYEYADMDELLNNNTVFELEGLADDSDKAFCVGLLIIFINEYRQVHKEIASSNQDLSHILVIEEAHRLLKNISTEKTSEDIGNPKGKAVEHFTNMIAEMRSYGQGVIVAEQIPSKLAPDVIKNSSNKIIQRLVAADDQELIANTIGLPVNDCIDLGNLTAGTALCHKEGMNLPVRVKIPLANENKISDGMLYGDNIKERLFKINLNIANEILMNHINPFALKMLNTILIQEYENVSAAIKKYRQVARRNLIKNNVNLVMCNNENSIYATLLHDSIIQYLLNGCYSIKQILPDKLSNAIYKLLFSTSIEKLTSVKEQFKLVYRDDIKYKGRFIIAQLVLYNATNETDIVNTIKNYFFDISDEEVHKIKSVIDRSESYDEHSGSSY